MRACAQHYLSEIETKSTALRSVLDSLAGLEGRKILVYVAGRFPADTALYCQSILRTPEVGPAAFSYRAGGFTTSHFVEHGCSQRIRSDVVPHSASHQRPRHHNGGVLHRIEYRCN